MTASFFEQYWLFPDSLPCNISALRRDQYMLDYPTMGI